MFGMNGNKMGPIGVDRGSGYLRMVQLGTNGQGLFLQAAGLSPKPEEIEFRSPAWQHWACESTQQLFRENDFKQKSVVTALPADDLFIDPLRLPASSMDRIKEILPQKLQKRLPFPVENALIQHIVIDPAEKNGSDIVDVLTISVNRESIDRHLAIYEKAGLDVRGISMWPTAMINSFSRFFCRRTNEQEEAVILINVGTNHTNVVITREANLLFARSVSIGYNQLEEGQMVQRLFSEIDACVRYFDNTAFKCKLGRIVFLAGTGASRTLCDRLAGLAQNLQVPAQIGDVISAVEINHGPKCIIDRRNCKVDWATAFGLSLDGIN